MLTRPELRGSPAYKLPEGARELRLFRETKTVGNLTQRPPFTHYSLRTNLDATPAQEVPEGLAVITAKLAGKVHRVDADRVCKIA